MIYVREDAGENEGRCPFLNPENHCCRIYEKRPEICKLFGSPGQKHPLLHCHNLGQGDPRESEKKIDEVLNRITGGERC